MDALNLFAACLIAGAQPPCDSISNLHPRAHLRLTLDQWQPLIDEASTRFGIPASWIRGVMRLESGGHETLNGALTTSSAGAMGLMQLMPATYADLRIRHGLGANPYDPRNSILAGAAYLREMYDAYGYPYLFAAYNAGPGRLNDFLFEKKPLPDATIAYLNAMSPGAGNAGSLPKKATAQAPNSLFYSLHAAKISPNSLAPDRANTSSLFVPLTSTLP
jgi:hypothetical protein